MLIQILQTDEIYNLADNEHGYDAEAGDFIHITCKNQGEQDQGHKRGHHLKAAGHGCGRRRGGSGMVV